MIRSGWVSTMNFIYRWHKQPDDILQNITLSLYFTAIEIKYSVDKMWEFRKTINAFRTLNAIQRKNRKKNTLAQKFSKLKLQICSAKISRIVTRSNDRYPLPFIFKASDSLVVITRQSRLWKSARHSAIWLAMKKTKQEKRKKRRK